MLTVEPVHELTGLIWAAALMRPSKSTTDMELKSVKKKFKDKKFAAGCSRDVITRGADGKPLCRGGKQIVFGNSLQTP